MKGSFRLSKEAENDLYDIAHYIAADSTDSAMQFLRSFEKTCKLLSHMPAVGHTPRLFREELQGIRMMPVSHFVKHLIFYRLLKGDSIEVIRVIHGARDYPSLFD